jgi:dTDP-4-dehydrorhamnose reductase
MKKKIYITGCGGMLGEAFYLNFKDDYILRCTDRNVNEEWLSPLNIVDKGAYRKEVIQFNPDYLFHLAALANIEACTMNPERAYLVNTIAVETAVKIANELTIPILYISTAGIFDGTKSMQDDWEMPKPNNVYARSKYIGERYVVENAKRYFVFRAGWMMGGGPAKDKKFVQKLMLQLKQGAKELFIIDNQFGSITYTHDFAKNVKLLIEKKCFGLYNMANTGQTSRVEIAKELLKILGLEKEVKITIVDAGHFKNQYVLKRPHYESIENLKLNLLGLNIMRDWKVALREYIETYYTNYL